MKYWIEFVSSQFERFCCQSIWPEELFEKFFFFALLNELVKTHIELRVYGIMDYPGIYSICSAFQFDKNSSKKYLNKNIPRKLKNAQTDFAINLLSKLNIKQT